MGARQCAQAALLAAHCSARCRFAGAAGGVPVRDAERRQRWHDGATAEAGRTSAIVLVRKEENPASRDGLCVFANNAAAGAGQFGLGHSGHMNLFLFFIDVLRPLRTATTL